MLLKEFFDLISSLHRIFQSENFSFSLSSENSLTWEVKYEKLYFRRSWNLLDKLRKSYRNGTVVKKLFTFLKLQKILGNSSPAGDEISNPGLNCTIVSLHYLFITWCCISDVSRYMCAYNFILSARIICFFYLIDVYI